MPIPPTTESVLEKTWVTVPNIPLIPRKSPQVLWVLLLRQITLLLSTEVQPVGSPTADTETPSLTDKTDIAREKIQTKVVMVSAATRVLVIARMSKTGLLLHLRVARLGRVGADASAEAAVPPMA